MTKPSVGEMKQSGFGPLYKQADKLTNSFLTNWFLACKKNQSWVIMKIEYFKMFQFSKPAGYIIEITTKMRDHDDDDYMH